MHLSFGLIWDVGGNSKQSLLKRKKEALTPSRYGRRLTYQPLPEKVDSSPEVVAPYKFPDPPVPLNDPIRYFSSQRSKRQE